MPVRRLGAVWPELIGIAGGGRGLWDDAWAPLAGVVAVGAVPPSGAVRDGPGGGVAERASKTGDGLVVHSGGGPALRRGGVAQVAANGVQPGVGGDAFALMTVVAALSLGAGEGVVGMPGRGDAGVRPVARGAGPFANVAMKGAGHGGAGARGLGGEQAGVTTWARAAPRGDAEARDVAIEAAGHCRVRGGVFEP